jgi:signal peptidase I
MEELEKKSNNGESKVSSIGKEILEWVFCFVIAYVLYLNINYFLGTISGVKQVSMFPTAKEGEKVLIQRTTIFKKNLKFGDIITFEAPIEKTNYDSSDVVADYVEYKGINAFIYNFMGIGKVSYIKRVIGIAGDHIVVNEKGEVYRNDQKLDEPYLNNGTTNQSGVFVDVVVPEGTIFVMGDNRLQSMDSRIFGCIPIDKVNAYVICRVWPFNKLGSL